MSTAAGTKSEFVANPSQIDSLRPAAGRPSSRLHRYTQTLRGSASIAVLTLVLALGLATAQTAQAQEATGGAGGTDPSLSLPQNGGDGGDVGASGGDGNGLFPVAGGAAGTATSPNGGDGANGDHDGDSGGGGGGGYSGGGTGGTENGDITSAMTGGDGGEGGGIVFTGGNTSIAGGGGGAGGDGVRINAASISVSASITGGDAGDGGFGYLAGGGGGGGGAGIVVLGVGSDTQIDSATVIGGAGGDGGDVWDGNAGNGGGGGSGVILEQGGSLILGNGTSVAGGSGGSGGSFGRGDPTGSGYGGSGGAGVLSKAPSAIAIESGSTVTGGAGHGVGNGGAAIVATTSGTTIVNAGTLQGGAGGGTSGGANSSHATGGNGSGGAVGGNANGGTGSGGVGILGAASGGITIVNSGLIVGGTGYGGQANAISLSGNDNRLELLAGYSFTGNVVVSGGGIKNVLALGGATDSIFDVSKIGAAQQYQGFNAFQKTGTGTWTLTNTTTAVTPWTLKQGTLSVASDASLGDVSGALTFDGGTLRNTASFASARNATLNAGGGTFQTDPLTTLTMNGVISGGGSLTKAGTGTLTLSGINTYTGGTQLLGGVLSVSTDANLGATSGALTFDGGTLANTAYFASSRNITLNAGGGTFQTGPGLTLHGTISGDGALTKTGTGTLWFTGANHYTGGTTVSDGVLALIAADDSTRVIVGGVTVSSAGTLSVQRADTSAITNITNSGNVSFWGTTSADNASITNASAGTLSFNQTSTTGDAAIMNSGHVRFWNTASASNASITNASAGTLSFNQTSTAGNATIMNSGYLGFFTNTSAENADITNDGNGTLDFYQTSTADNAKIVNDNSFHFFSSSTAGNSTITNNADLSFYNNATGGNAAITNGANGFVDFSGSSGPNGDGKLSVGSLAGAGHFYLGGRELTVGGRNESTVVSGVISDGGILGGGGTGGSLVKTGTGTLTLNGVNTYTGLTTINSGKLVVGDDTHATASLLGGVVVNAGSTLGGIGSVGATTITAGGIHAPGNSPGTQTINGNYANHGTLQIDVTPTLSDKLIVNGTVDISGATLSLLMSPTSAADWNINNGPYTIIANDGADAVTGTVNPVTKNLLFLDETLDYAGGDGNDVTLKLTRNDLDFADVGRTPNQKATAGGIESLGSGNPVWNAIALQSDEDATRAAFDQLSGEIHASAKSALIEDSRFLRDAVNQRIRSAFGGVGAASMPMLAYGENGTDNHATGAISQALAPADKANLAAWGSVFGSWGSTDGDGNAAKLSRSVGGFFTGIDGQVAENIRLGIMTGYSHTSFDVDGRSSSGESDNYHLGIYGGTQMGNLGLRAGVAYTWHDISTSRSVAFPGFADSLNADYHAGTFQAFGEAGYRIDTATASFEPFANLAYVNLHTDGFTEKGGAAALTSSSQTTDTTFTTLGVRASTAFDLGGVKATARGMIAWRHAFGDTTPLAMLAFAGGSAFTVAGVPIAKDAAVVEAGLDFAISDNATFGISYSGQFGSHARDNGAKANLRVEF